MRVLEEIKPGKTVTLVPKPVDWDTYFYQTLVEIRKLLDEHTKLNLKMKEK